MTMQTLREQSQAMTHGASAAPLRTFQSCEIVARLESVPDTANDRLVFQAKALFEGPHTQAGQIDTYAVRADKIKECLDNLNKGAGAQPGSVLVFGNAWRDDETGHVSIGWVTTAISAQKAQAELNGHHTRHVEAVFAQMPVLEFTNTRPAVAEPERIRWPLGLDSIEVRVNSGGHWQTVAFDREWLTKKLAAAWEARQQDKVSINMRLPVLHPDQAIAIQDEESARNAIVTLLTENRYRNLVTRISDGNTVETRRQPMMRGDDPAAWADKLLSQTPGFDEKGQPVANPETGEQVMVDAFSLIKGIANRLLLAAVNEGKVKMEFMPREGLLVATKKAPGLANDIKQILQANSNREMHSINFAFGNDPEAVSRVALVRQMSEDRQFVVAGPHRLETGPHYNFCTVPSAHLNIAKPAAAPTQPPVTEAPLDEAQDPAQEIPPFEDGDFEIDAEGAMAASSEVNPAAVATPVPAQQATSQTPQTELAGGAHVAMAQQPVAPPRPAGPSY